MAELLSGFRMRLSGRHLTRVWALSGKMSTPIYIRGAFSADGIVCWKGGVLLFGAQRCGWINLDRANDRGQRGYQRHEKKRDRRKREHRQFRRLHLIQECLEVAPQRHAEPQPCKR